MTRPRLPRAKKRDVVSLRFSPEERAVIELAAKRDGVGFPVFVRNAALAAAGRK